MQDISHHITYQKYCISKEPSSDDKLGILLLDMGLGKKMTVNHAFQLCKEFKIHTV